MLWSILYLRQPLAYLIISFGQNNAIYRLLSKIIAHPTAFSNIYSLKQWILLSFQIYDSSNKFIANKLLIEQLKGTMEPVVIKSIRNVLALKFRSDGSNSFSGFSATLSAGGYLNTHWVNKIWWPLIVFH